MCLLSASVCAGRPVLTPDLLPPNGALFPWKHGSLSTKVDQMCCWGIKGAADYVAICVKAHLDNDTNRQAFDQQTS